MCLSPSDFKSLCSFCHWPLCVCNTFTYESAVLDTVFSTVVRCQKIEVNRGKKKFSFPSCYLLSTYHIITIAADVDMDIDNSASTNGSKSKSDLSAVCTQSFALFMSCGNYHNYKMTSQRFYCVFRTRYSFPWKPIEYNVKWIQALLLMTKYLRTMLIHHKNKKGRKLLIL